MEVVETAQKLSSSQRIISGIAQGARGQAILKNATTRLIIYSDSASNKDEEKKLRYFGIVYEDRRLIQGNGLLRHREPTCPKEFISTMILRNSWTW